MSHNLVIDCQKVTKDFPLSGGREPTRILQGINLQVQATEYVIIFGPSGCGKSTFLHLLAGLERPNSGTIKIRGEDIVKFDQRRLALHRRSKIGLVFQQFNLLSNLTALENVALPQIFSGSRLRQRTNRGKQLLGKMGIEKLADKLPSEMSGGEQQRVAIARSLVNSPWIMLVDEPTGDLDSKSADEVMDIIFKLNEQSRRTILLVTHNPDYLHFAHRVIYMKDGVIVKEEKIRKMSEHKIKEEVI